MSRSVVVVSMRCGDWLEPCLGSVRDQADQVVVVDNGSVGAEVSALARQFDATVVRNGENQGFAGGANRGIRQATGDVVALLNDDAIAGPSWLDDAEDALSDPSVGAVTPKVLLDGWYGQVVPSEEAWYGPSDARPLGRRLTSVQQDGTEVLDRLVGPGIHRLESGVVEGRPMRWRWTRPGKPYFIPLPGPIPDATVTLDGGEELTVSAVCRLINNAGLFLRSDGYSGDHGLESPDDGRWDRPRETFGTSGTAMVVRAEVLERVGLVPRAVLRLLRGRRLELAGPPAGTAPGLPTGQLGLPPAVGDLGSDPRSPGTGPGRAQPAPDPGAQRPRPGDGQRGPPPRRRRP